MRTKSQILPEEMPKTWPTIGTTKRATGRWMWSARDAELRLTAKARRRHEEYQRFQRLMLAAEAAVATLLCLLEWAGLVRFGTKGVVAVVVDWQDCVLVVARVGAAIALSVVGCWAATALVGVVVAAVAAAAAPTVAATLLRAPGLRQSGLPW